MKKRVPFFLFVLGLCVTYGSVVFSAPAFGPGEYLDPPCAPGSTYLGDDCTTSVGWQVNTTDGFVFNSTDLVGIGTDTPTTTLDVRGGFFTVYTAPDGVDVGSDPDGYSQFINGDLGIAGNSGQLFFTGDTADILTLTNYAIGLFNYDENGSSALIGAQNGIYDTELTFNSFTGGVRIGSELEDDSADAYLEIFANGEVNFFSNPTANTGSFIEMETDGDLELYSVIDDMSGSFTEYSSLTLENNSGAPRLNAAANTVIGLLDIGANLILDPNNLSSIGVDDQADGGTYSATFGSNYSTGITVSHTDISLNLVDVGTFYWGGIDSGGGTIIDRVITNAAANNDYMMNQWMLNTSGISYSFQSGTGATYGPSGTRATLSINDNLAFDTSFVNLSGDQSAGLFDTTVTAIANTSSTSYKGVSGVVEYTSDFNLSGIGATVEAPLIGVYGEATNSGDGDIDGIVGGDFRASHDGLGVVDQLRGVNILAGITGGGDVNSMDALNVSAFHLGAGTMDSAQALTFLYTHNGTGITTTAYGVTGAVTSSASGGSISDAYGANFRLEADDGTIGDAIGVKINALITGTGSITDATGVEFNAGLYGITPQPGLEGTGSIKGLSFGSFAGEGSLEGANVYALYIDTVDSLQGATDEYALYIGDTDAENWFSNGLMIGDDDAGLPDLDSKIDDDNSGSGSTQLYIGTNTIDTTAPSDERTKENILATVYGIDDLDQIDVVDFVYDQSVIDDDSRQHTGVLAQQVESIYPEAVSRRSDGYLMVDYKTFIPLMIKSIQDLRAEIVGMFSNFVTDVFTTRRATVTEEFCVGSVCVNEAEFGEIVDQIRDNEGLDDSSGSEDNSDDQGGGDDISDDGGIPDENIDPVPEPDPQENIEDEAGGDEEGQPEPSPEPSPEPESVPDEGGGEPAPTE